MAKTVPLEVPEQALPAIFAAGGVSLTHSEVLDLQYWILTFTHGYSRALIGGKLTDDEVELLHKTRRAATALEARLRQLDLGLMRRLETADEIKRRRASGYSLLSELAANDPRLRLIGPDGLLESVNLLISATDAVLTTPVRKKAERNLATGHFMQTVKLVFDAAEHRESPRKSKWRAFFREFYRALPQPTKTLLVSEDAALKQLDRAKRSRTR